MQPESSFSKVIVLPHNPIDKKKTNLKFTRLGCASPYTHVVLPEQRKSSNTMPNHFYLIARTLTFSSSYLMVLFIYQTNVRNTIPQAQSLWHQRQLSPPSIPLPPLPLTALPLDCERRSSDLEICNTGAVSQTVI